MDYQERIHDLTARAVEVLEDGAAAEGWMRAEIVALGGKCPMDVAKTVEGYDLCRAILGRLEHGVFS
jgi:uncharacterized protein (DUF2384 family)